MKSGKQRRQEISARRKKLKFKHAVIAKPVERAPTPCRLIPVNETLLAPNNSYGAPDFVQRGYYVDRLFRCVDCGKEEVWTGTQQKWWYEVAKGFGLLDGGSLPSLPTEKTRTKRGIATGSPRRQLT